MKFRVTMERLGRGAPPEPFEIDVEDVDSGDKPDDGLCDVLAHGIYKIARTRLASRDVEVVVSMSESTVDGLMVGQANVYAGFHSAGRGAVEEVAT